ncbi:hypothetical protein TSMEX_005596, partial [Taenia solium]
TDLLTQSLDLCAENLESVDGGYLAGLDGIRRCVRRSWSSSKRGADSFHGIALLPLLVVGYQYRKQLVPQTLQVTNRARYLTLSILVQFISVSVRQGKAKHTLVGLMYHKKVKQDA